MKVRRGAHNAINSWASTGKSPAFLLPKVDSAAPYFKKLPAIQWYSPEPVRFSTASPKLRRCNLAPPSPEETTSAIADRKSVVEGKRVDLGGCRIIKKKQKNTRGVLNDEKARRPHRSSPGDPAVPRLKPDSSDGRRRSVVVAPGRVGDPVQIAAQTSVS